MTDDGIEVFVKWLLYHGITSDRARRYFTVAAFLCDHESLPRLWEGAPADLLDEALAEEFLSRADPRETVEILMRRLGRDISPGLFKKLFDRTLAASSSVEVLSRLMFVAGMYLDRHPGAFSLPRKLADQLLASDDMDHRLAGLKALRHSAASFGEVIAQITAALMREDWHERYAGLSQLGKVLEATGPQQAEAIDEAGLDELRNILTEIANAAQDDDTRRMAAHYSALLERGDAASRRGRS